MQSHFCSFHKGFSLPIHILLFFGCWFSAFSQDDYSVLTEGVFSPVTLPEPTLVEIGDEELIGPLPIGFPFFFFGRPYEQFYISDNGFITFDADAGTGCCSGQSLPDPTAPNNLIAFAWEDLDPGVHGSVNFQTVETAPNRKLVVNFEDILHYNDTESQFPVTAQVILYEGTDIIEIHTEEMLSNGGLHTMGVENEDGSGAYTVSGRNAVNWSANSDFASFVPKAPSSIDAGLISILPVTFREGENALKATVLNYGQESLTNLEFRWMFNDTLKEPVSWSGNLARGEGETVFLDTVFLELGKEYELEVWVTANSDENLLNDTISIADFSPYLRSYYTVGLGHDFSTINDAVAILGQGPIFDSVKFSIAPGVYNEQVAVDQSVNSSCTMPVIFESSTGNPEDVIWTYAPSASDNNYTLWLNGVDGVKFRHLTLQTTGATYARVVEVSNGASCNQFEGNIIQGDIISESAGSTGKELIYSPSEGDPIADPDNLFLENHFIGGTWAIYLGTVYSEKETGTRIVKNHFDRQAVRAIEGKYQEGIVIDRNLIEGSETTPYIYSGILLLTCGRAIQVTANRIIIPKGDKGIYLRNCNGLSLAGYQGVTANNFVLIREGIGTAVRGIQLDLPSQYQNFYYNTVNILASSPGSAAFLMSDGKNIKSINNIWSNQAGGYAVFFYNELPLEADYNCLYTTGNYLVFSNSGRYNTLDAWQSATGQESASVSIAPTFIDPADYHVSEVALNGAGTPITGITTDLDGQIRDPEHPDIGADEFTPDIGADAGIVEILNPGFPFSAGDHPVEMVLRNWGTELLAQATVKVSISGTETESFAWAGNLLEGETDTLSFGQFSFELGTIYQITAWTEEPNGVPDARPENDTTTVSGLTPSMSGVYTIGGSDPDFPNFSLALSTLHSSGVMDEVNFKIRSGAYVEQLVFQDFPRNTDAAKVRFESEAKDSTAVVISYQASSDAENYTLLLDGAAGLSFEYMTIEAKDSVYGQAIVLQKGAAYNEFHHNLIRVYGHLTLSNQGVGGVVAKGDPSLPHHHNVFRNNRIEGGYFGISYERGGSEYGEISPCVEIADNLFVGQSKAPLEVFLNKTSDGYIQSNEIQLSTSITGELRGLWVSGGVGSRINGNTIRVFHNGAPGSATLTGLEYDGLAIVPDSWGTTLISNNSIAIQGGEQITTGIDVGGNQVDIFHNTIWVNAATAQALYTSGSTEQRLYNNLLVNEGPGYVFAMGALPSTLISDHNGFFTPSGDLCVIGFGSNANIITTLEEWQFQSGQDAHSIFVNPLFTEAPIDLHVGADALNDAGLALPMAPDDIDGDPRDPLFPDIGADEFIPSRLYDAGVLSMNAPTVPFPAGSNPMEVTLRNAGREALQAISVEWAVNGIRQPGAVWTGQLSTGDTVRFMLGDYAFLPNIAHQLKVWTALSNDEQVQNDTLLLENIYAALQGGYTIGGQAPDFLDFSQAVQALTYGGVLGAVQFQVRPGIYDEQITLPAIPGATATNTITFGAEIPTGPEVRLTFFSDDPTRNYTIQLDGASHITFRDMTLKSRGIDYGHVVDLRNGAAYNQFINNRIQGIYVLETSDSLALVYGADEQSRPGHFNTFTGNTFQGGNNGVLLDAGDWDEALQGVVLDQNVFVDQYLGAIDLTYVRGASIRGNQITNDDFAHEDYQGLQLKYGVDGFTVSNNNLDLVKGRYGILIDIGSPNDNATETNRGLLINNFIHLRGGNASAGLKMTGSYHQGIYFNSVHLSGDSDITDSRAFEIDNSSGLEVFNNIFTNSTAGYAVYAADSYSRFTSDHNCFYSYGPVLAFRRQPLQDLAAWQSNTDQDAASIAEDPVFLSDEDLHARAPLIDGQGIPIDGVSTDIDGEPRNADHPDIGADEFTPVLGADAGLPVLLSPTTVPDTVGQREVRVILRNYGVEDLTSADIVLAVNGEMVQKYSWTGLLGTGERDSLLIDTLNFTLGNVYDLELWIETANGETDPWAPNDTLSQQGLHPYMRGIYTIGGNNPDFYRIAGAMDTLHAMGVMDSVFFRIRNGAYREQLLLRPFEGSDVLRPVTFASESGDSSSVVIEHQASAAANNYVLRLDSLANVAFHHLTFQSLSPDYGRILEIQHPTGDLTFENNVFKVAAGNMTSEAVLGRDGYIKNYPGISFIRNFIEGGGHGFVFTGQSRNAQLNSIRLLNNTFLGQDKSAIQLKWAANPVIVGNRINTLSADSSFVAISLEQTRDFDINKNKITIYNGGRGIFLNDCSRNTGIGALFPPLVSNNFIYVGGNLPSGGVVIWNSPAVQLYFNNIHVAAPESVALFASHQYALFVQEDNKLDLINNNLVNSGYGLALQINPSFDYWRNIDYNNLYTNGDILAARGGSLSYTTLEAWQTASGLDAHSISVDPYFLRPDDLHVHQILLNEAGLEINYDITNHQFFDDIDGEPRDRQRPDIGADEFTPKEHDLRVSEILSPQYGCGLGPEEPVWVVVQNVGLEPVQGFQVGFVLDDQAAVVAGQINKVLSSGDTALILFDQTVDLSEPVDHRLVAFCRYDLDENPVNDTFPLDLAAFPPMELTLTPDTAICQGESIRITASTNLPASFRWVHGAREDWFWADPDTTTTYIVEATNTYGCTLIDSVNVTVYIPVIPEIIFQQDTVCAGETASLWVEPSGELLWSTGDTSTILLVDQSGMYGVVRTDEHGCKESAEEVAITVLPAPAIDVQGFLPLCRGDTLGLMVTDATHYLWSTGATDPFISVAPRDTTTYTVQVRNDFGCEDTLSVFIPVIPVEPPPQPLHLLPADSTFELSLPLIFSWEGSPQSAYYDLYAWPVGQDPPVGPILRNLTQVNYSLTDESNPYPYFRYGTTYRWWVVAKNSCFSTPSDTQVFSLRHLPDLVIDTIEVPVEAYSGQKLSLAWIVRNDGVGETPVSRRWFDGVFLSEDSIFSTGAGALLEKQLAVFQNVSALKPGESYRRTAEVTLPESQSGWRYIFVVPDQGVTVIKETDEENNRSKYARIPVVLTPPPDLQVTSVLSQTSAFSGLPLEVTWTVTNMGESPTRVGKWRDFIYLSDNLSFNPEQSFYLGNLAYQDGLLEAGSSYTQNKIVTLPEGIAGTFYLFVETDQPDYVYESPFERNNDGRSAPIEVTLKPPPDLYVSSVNLPDVISGGADLTFEFTVSNQGGSVIEKSWTDWIFLATKQADEPRKKWEVGKVKHNQDLPPSESLTQTLSFFISDTLAGPYDLIIELDYGDEVYEYTYEENNHMEIPIDVSTPDLIVTKLTVPDTAWSGRMISLEYVVKNNGLGNLIDREFRDQIVVHSEAEYDFWTAKPVEQLVWQETLMAGDSMVVSTEVELPEGISGPYYLSVYTDYPFLLPEGAKDILEIPSEENNILRSEDYLWIWLSPWWDLEPVSLEAPDTVTAGAESLLSFTVRNNGPGPVESIEWTDKIVYYYSIEPPILDTVATVSHQGLFPVDSTYKEDVLGRMPCPLEERFDELTLLVDADKQFYEYTEEYNNELFSDPVYFRHSAVDLSVLPKSVPDTVLSSRLVSIQFHITNIGESTTCVRKWGDRIYLSQDSLIDSTDQLIRRIHINEEPPPPEYRDPLGTYLWVLSLPTGASYTIAETFEAPDGVSGRYYIIVESDYGQRLSDPERTNNTLIYPLEILFAEPPDLQPVSLTPPEEIYAGLKLPYQWTVENRGVGEAYPSQWKDRLYLSRDFIVDKHDRVLGELQRGDGLSPGQSYTKNAELFIPANVSGNYLLLLVTDDQDTVYEHRGEGNNVLAVPVEIHPLPPVDLIVDQIYVPEEVQLGQRAAIEWTTCNIGENPTKLGYRDAVYLSRDTILDEGDWLFGSLENRHHHLPGEVRSQRLAGVFQGLLPGDYYILVRADAQNSIPETNEMNNQGISLNLVRLTVEELLLDVPALNELPHGQSLIYRLEIPDSLSGESLLLEMDADSIDTFNELSLAYDQIASRVNHDFSSKAPFTAHQEIVVPSLFTGTYYTDAYGYSAVQDTQDVRLLATILPFELRNYNPQKGGNTGTVTIELKGSKFDAGMTVILRNSEMDLTVEELMYESSTRAFVRFDLAEIPAGWYDFHLENSVGDVFVWDEAFEVVEGGEGALAFKAIHPAQTNPRRIVPITLEFANGGYTDLISPKAEILSLFGAPLALEIEELGREQTTIILPLQEFRGPEGILRPGGRGTITVYTQATHILIFFVRKAN